MNLGKIFSLIAENNIDPEQVLNIVEKVKNTDLKDEKNIRDIIHEISALANRKLDKQQEDQLVKKIMSDGVTEDLFEMI